MDQDRVIAEVATRNGVLLDRDDAVLVINTMLELHDHDHKARDEEFARRMDAFATRMEQLLEEAKTQAAGEIARRAIAELPRHAGQLVRQEHRKLFWQIAGLLVMAFVAGGTVFAGWQWFYGKPFLVACDATKPQGSQCWYQSRQ